MEKNYWMDFTMKRQGQVFGMQLHLQKIIMALSSITPLAMMLAERIAAMFSKCQTIHLKRNCISVMMSSH